MPAGRSCGSPRYPDGVCMAAVFEPLITEELLARLSACFPNDVLSLASQSHESIQQRIGEQRVLRVLQSWHEEQRQATPLHLADGVQRGGG